jgi:hypothetical protein
MKTDSKGRFIKTDPEERFWSKVNKTDTCWLWQGTKYKRGNYGGFSFENKSIKAHRYSYLIHYKNLPDDLLIMHLCDNPLCVRPDHLCLGTHKENMKDMTDKNRQAKGSKVHLAKLTEEDVFNIKQKLLHSYRGILTELAKEYNVSIPTIYSIDKKKTWKHV